MGSWVFLNEQATILSFFSPSCKMVNATWESAAHKVKWCALVFPFLMSSLPWSYNKLQICYFFLLHFLLEQYQNCWETNSKTIWKCAHKTQWRAHLKIPWDRSDALRNYPLWNLQILSKQHLAALCSFLLYERIDLFLMSSPPLFKTERFFGPFEL